LEFVAVAEQLLEADGQVEDVHAPGVAAAIDAKAGRVHLATDSNATSDHDVVMPMVKHRVFDDGTIVAAAGYASAMPLIARHCPPVGPYGGDVDDLDDWAQAWAEDVTEFLLDRGHHEADTPKNLEDRLIIAHADRMWEVSDYLALPISCGYHAVGSGATVALGALHALTAAGVSAEVAVIGAVDACVEHCEGIGGDVRSVAT
jgi:ATP-dependent protease HslVU (ClpYQ) peptidase subunit